MLALLTGWRCWLVAALAIGTGCTTTRQHTVPPRVPLVSFVFDDGYDTDYLVARDIFAEHGAVACTAITTGWINHRDHLTADQIRALRDDGWEILGHTVSHPHLPALSYGRVEDELRRSKATLEGLGLAINNVVYPYTASNGKVRHVARKYYRSGRDGKNEINWNATNRYGLRAVSNPKHNLKEMKAFIERAYAQKGWLIIYHHRITAEITIAGRHGRFTEGEEVLFRPSGARGLFLRNGHLPNASHLLFVPLSGRPQHGDRLTGATSGATARVGYVLQDQRATIAELLRHVRSRHPDMQIVTVNQALDILGAPPFAPPPKREDGPR
jgi:peptidoglycan/xylan/chitin deacetylase (PgdA/CDA1 family)